ncbi:MAG: hypothetical protein KBG48_32025 [Kofleriaceae bacterium]|jgi:hypothetical protein|nr:hypothetical protein [Kofleriaceae bacterium]MBP9862576.1 hypothetical protein [Kofleriaceae bacterium]
MRLSHRLPHLALLSALVLPACAEPTPETPDLATEMLGSWRETPHASDDPVAVGDRDLLTFTDDGQLTQVVDGETQVGPWALVGDRLTMQLEEPSETLTLEHTVAVIDGHLLMAVALPQGAVDGPVGTWRTEMRVNARMLDRTIVLGGDGAATLREQIDDDAPFEAAGIWTEFAPGQIEIQLRIGDNTTLSLDTFLRGDRLGLIEYERI